MSQPLSNLGPSDPLPFPKLERPPHFDVGVYRFLIRSVELNPARDPDISRIDLVMTYPFASDRHYVSTLVPKDEAKARLEELIAWVNGESK